MRTAALALLAYLAAFDIFFAVTRLQWLARAILAAGIAVTAVRLLRDHPGRTSAWLLRTTWILAPTVAVLGIGTFALLRFQESRREAALPARVAGAPNVLLLILDTVRAANLSLYGYVRPTTPQLSRLASRGVVFDHALSTASWTVPSHASIFTGRWAAELSTDWRSPLDSRDPTLAEVFDTRGYRTAGFVANFWRASRESGLARGFDHYEDDRLTLGDIVFASSLGQYVTTNRGLRRLLHWNGVLGRKTASVVRQDVEDWIQKNDDRPFFVFANFFDAHDPYSPAPPFDTLFTGHLLSWGERDVFRDPARMLRPDIQRNEEAMYDGAIASIDAEIGRLLTDLDRQGKLRNTIVVITADHGEEFGEHGVPDHGNSLYLRSVHVPLVIAAPRGVAAGTRVAQWVSLRDLPATILDLAGAPAALPGRSLSRFWNGGATSDTLFTEVRHATGLPPAFPVSRGDVESALAGNWRLITTGKNGVELFDLATDSMEMRNRSGDSPIPLARLSDALRHGPARSRH